MNSFDREVDFLFEKGQRIIITLIIYLVISILLTFNFDLKSSPIEFMLNTIFLDNGNYFNPREFSIPFSFLILHLLPVLIISDLFFSDYMKFATYLLGKCNSKREYFLGKFTVMALANFFFGAICFSTLCLYLTLMGDNDAKLMIGFVRVGVFYILENILFTNFVFILALFTSFRIAIFVFFLNLFIPIVSNSRLFLGQGSLVMKQDFYGGEFDLKINLIVIVAYFLIFLLLTYFLPKHYNFYGSKR